MTEDHAGELLDHRFEIERRVAAGGMGVVYRALDHHTGAPVALKRLTATSHVSEARFTREANVLAGIHHPSIVAYVAHGRTPEGGHYLVMEWLEGITLADRIRRLARSETVDDTRAGSSARSLHMAMDEALTVTTAVASALAELHRRGVVHRDIKPSNLFLPSGDAGRLKLLDFGTARLGAGAPALTGTGVLVGTPLYMSPEQVRGQSELSPAADVWSLGCVLYECLSGASPFRAEVVTAVLAKILLGERQPLDRRVDAPEALVGLVDRMLASHASDRFKDGQAVLDALAAAPLRSSMAPLTAPAAVVTTGGRLTTDEQRVDTILLARGLAGIRKNVARRAELERALAAVGARPEPLPDGALLVVVEGLSNPTDHATAAARAALVVREQTPTASLFLSTGRRSGRVRQTVSELVERAARGSQAVPPGAIGLDDLTTALLDRRFAIEHAPDGNLLEAEREAEVQRTLLGRPSRYVGRRRELALLHATFEDAVEESVAQVVLVTAQAGVGKTRLSSEFVHTVQSEGELVTVLVGHGEPLSAGSPFVMLSGPLRRSCGIVRGDSEETQRDKLWARVASVVAEDHVSRVAAFLGELMGVRLPVDAHPMLAAARSDPMLLGEGMRRAFLDWLDAETLARPVLIVLEDLHWGDLPSVKLVDAALLRLAERPLMVLTLARPEVHERLPHLFAERAMNEIRLGGLTRRAATSLARHVLGQDADEALIEGVVERAGGNAFYLEELLRAVAEGEKGELPDTVLGMVHNRLDALGEEAKRVLRAASFFGDVFWAGAVAHLLDAGGASGSDGWLEQLAKQEIVTRRAQSRVPGTVEYAFRHALVREGAYATLTGEDRALGHLLAGQWLEAHETGDALGLAEHFIRGGHGARAAAWFARAAEQALEGNDLTAAAERARRAEEAGALGPTLGQARAIASIAAYWQSDYEAGLEAGELAASDLAEGSQHWFTALGSAVVSAARLGDFGCVDGLLGRIVPATPAPDAHAAQLVALSRGAFQLVFNGRFEAADVLLATIAGLADHAGQLDPHTRAQLEHVRGVRAAHVGDVSCFLMHLERAVSAFEEAGDVRNVSLEHTTLAWCHAELGDLDRAEADCRASLARCEQLRAQQAITYAKVNLGFILALREATRGEAESVLEEAIAECGAVKNRRLEGWALAHLSRVADGLGDHAAGLRHARAAAGRLDASPGLRAWALGTVARALLALDRPDEALAPARESMAILDEIGGLLQGESLPPLVLARTLTALGQEEEARRVAEDARQRLERRALRIEDAAARALFLALPDNVATLAL